MVAKAASMLVLLAAAAASFTLLVFDFFQSASGFFFYGQPLAASFFFHFCFICCEISLKIILQFSHPHLPNPCPPSLSGGTVASRTNREPTAAPPTPTRRRHQRGRSCTVTAAFLWTARVCRRPRVKHRQVAQQLRHPTFSSDTGTCGLID